MGGFAFYGSFDDNTPESLFEISTNPHCIVDVPKFDALIYIMKHFPHILTDITEDCILDQAASSSLSKALLFVQVAWFCANCASRLSQRLSLSLLEVSTAAHAFCTLFTYVMWWSKPINVAAPTLLRQKEAREVYALLKCSCGEYDHALEMARERERAKADASMPTERHISEDIVLDAGALCMFKCSDGEHDGALEMAGKRAKRDTSMPTKPHISEKIVLAAGALQHLLPTPERPPSSSFSNRDRMLPLGTIRDDLPNEDFSIAVALAASPVLYGLIHVLAWSGQFPTSLEQRLWRASSLVVSFSGLVGVFVALFSDSLKVRYKPVTITSTINVPGAVMFWATVFVIVVLHVLASGFLIGESVRQLFFLNDAAYQLPDWSNYWPHFS